MEQDLKIVFDIDGTLCPIKEKDEAYIDLVPDAAMIARMHEYKERGATIVLFTSRNMKTYQGNIGKLNNHRLKPVG